MNIDQPTAQAVAIDGGTIYAVGDDQEILSLAGAETQRIDLEGKILFPGFIDSHGHRITQRGKWGFSTVLEAAQEALSLGWTSLTELAVDQGQLQEMIDAQKSGELNSGWGLQAVNMKIPMIRKKANTLCGFTFPSFF